MLPRRGLVLVAAVLLVLVPGAAAGHSRPPSSVGHAPDRLLTDEMPLPPRAATEPLAGETPLKLTFTLGFSNASRLTSTLQRVEDPASPQYRHFLSASEFRQDFGPSPATDRLLREQLLLAGANSIAVSPDGVVVQAELPADGVAALLGVQPVGFGTTGGGRAYTVVGTPTLPAALVGKVIEVVGLSGGGSLSDLLGSLTATTLPTPLPPLFPSFVKSGLDDWYIGTDYAQAYGAPELLPGAEGMAHATYPDHVAIATLGASGYNAGTSTVLPPWDPAVVDTYYNDTFPAGWPLPKVSGDAVSIPGVAAPPAPGPSFGVIDTLGYSVENSLDLEMAGSVAPGATLVNFYFSAGALYSAFPPSALGLAG